MKKFMFIALAVLAFTACDPTTSVSKCSDVNELKEAITKGSTDTARYDLNGDGEITVADLNFLIHATNDSTKVAKDTI